MSPEGYEVRYLIVAGIAWLRSTRGAPAGDERLWLATFDGEPRMRTAPARFGDVPLVGEVDGVSWELHAEELAPPFRSPHRLLRPLAPSGMEVWPALRVSGRVGERSFDGAPGHRARVWGPRHAERWGWAHGSTADGRWVHLLSAKLRGLPRLSQHACGRAPGLPVARASVAPGRVRVGPYVAEAPPGSFLDVRYHDPDGTPVTCRHSEQGRVRGPGLELERVAIEVGGR